MSTNESVKKIIAEQLGLESSEIKDEASLIQDLGADSLDVTEMMMSFEETFNVEITEDEASKISTVGDIIKYIDSKK